MLVSLKILVKSSPESKSIMKLLLNWNCYYCLVGGCEAVGKVGLSWVKSVGGGEKQDCVAWRPLGLCSL